MVWSPSLQCCSPRRPLLMLSLACRLDTHAAVAVRRRTSLLDVGDLGALGPRRAAARARCALAVSPHRWEGTSSGRHAANYGATREESSGSPIRFAFLLKRLAVTELTNSARARSGVTNLLRLPLDAVDAS